MMLLRAGQLHEAGGLQQSACRQLLLVDRLRLGDEVWAVSSVGRVACVMLSSVRRKIQNVSDFYVIMVFTRCCL